MTNPHYLSDFTNGFATEALPSALSESRNSPQPTLYGLYAEQLSGTASSAPRHANRRSWLYRRLAIELPPQTPVVARHESKTALKRNLSLIRRVNMFKRIISVSFLAACTFSGTAFAQSPYPTRAVTIVVPAAAGGPTDAVARVVAESLQRQSGQAFVIDNVAGGGSTIGTARVAVAKADGYTLLWGGSSGMVVAPHLVPQVKYDPLTSFANVGIVAYTPYAVIVKESSQFQTFEQLIAYAKANPGKLNVASTGAGTQGHLTIEMLLEEAGIKVLHVPFKGSPPAITALIGGDVDVLLDAPGPAMAMIAGKRLRALAVTSQKRLPNLPDARTIQEAGVNGFESQAWWTLQAPRGTPEPVMQSLQKMLTVALADPETLEALKKNALVPGRANPADVAETIQRESPRWARIIKQHNIKME